MPKFGRALAVQLVSALVLVFAVLFAANHFLLDKVYLAGKKQELGDLTRETPPEDRQALASSRGWVLAEVPFQRDEEALNGDLGVRLVRAGMPLNRFWLTSETIGALAGAKRSKRSGTRIR